MSFLDDFFRQFRTASSTADADSHKAESLGSVQIPLYKHAVSSGAPAAPRVLQQATDLDVSPPAICEPVEAAIALPSPAPVDNVTSLPLRRAVV